MIPAPPSQEETSLPFPVLIADIGGTNARFSIVLDADAEPSEIFTTRTADHKNLGDAIQSVVLAQTTQMPSSAVLAVAGAVNGDEIDLTNNHWIVNPSALLHMFSMQSIVVLNDFEAQALAVSALEDDDLKQIAGGATAEHGNRVVVGPGTGLGVAGIVRAPNTWVPVRGEGGHVSFGPLTARDNEIFPHLEPIEGRISAEQILCGRGLLNLYRAIAAAAGDIPKCSSPEAVTAAAIGKSDIHAVETISLFCTYLGRLAGDMALVFNATGGVYLSGGISQKILDIFDHDNYKTAFSDKAPHSEMVADMPTFVVLHEQAPMIGLTAYAQHPHQFGIVLDGRYWSN